MARPREFDMDEAVSSARDAFWARGYDGTSLSDLTEATGVAKASLYQAFGDKRALYLLTLERYQREGQTLLARTVDEARTAADGVRALLELIAHECTGERAELGCFFVNSVVGVGSRDLGVRRLLEQHLGFLERLLEKALRRAADAREVPRSLEPRSAARFLVNTIVGMHALSRTFPRERRYRETVDWALAAVGLQRRKR